MIFRTIVFILLLLALGYALNVTYEGNQRVQSAYVIRVETTK